jgi:hypothetical protein
VGVNDWRFPDLQGEVLWVPEKMHVTNARSGLYGGTARFDYLLAPLNQRGVPARADWDVEYGTSTSRASPTSSKPTGFGWPVVCRAATAWNGRSAGGPRVAGKVA